MKVKIILIAILVNGAALAVSASPIKPMSVVKVAGFDAFHAHRQADGVALAWQNSSAGVVNYIIQHSWDGNTFNTIDQVTPDMKGWENYNDGAALPGFNYYRIGAQQADGTIEWSDVEVVRIVQRK